LQSKVCPQASIVKHLHCICKYLAGTCFLLASVYADRREEKNVPGVNRVINQRTPMKNRLAGLPGVALGATLGVPGAMSPPLKELVDALLNSARQVLREGPHTDPNVVAIARAQGGEARLTISTWRTEHGKQFRANQLREELVTLKPADVGDIHALCVIGPNGPDWENSWFCYSEDANGCWFALLPVVNGTLGEPDFRPSTELDSFHQILPNPLFS
jgi:hypothetical protein